MLGFMSLISDGGISAGVLSEGGKVWQDREKLGAVLNTGLLLRKKFSFYTLVITLPILLYLLIHNNASFITSILIVLALIPAFFATLSDSLLEIIPKLHQDVFLLQKNQIVVATSRFFLSICFLFFFPFTYIAILASGIPRVLGNIGLKKLANKFVSNRGKYDLVVKKQILSTVRKILPTTIYFSLTGQITIWITSVIGKTSILASIGALGRIAMILNILSVIGSTLIIPRFARLRFDKRSIANFAFFSVLGIVLISVLLIFFTWLLSSKILYILGTNYSKLDFELVLSMTGACITMTSAICFGLYTSRGYLMNPMLAILVDIFAISIGLYFFDVSSLTGVLYFNILTATFLFLTNSIYLVFRIINLPPQQ